MKLVRPPLLTASRLAGLLVVATLTAGGAKAQDEEEDRPSPVLRDFPGGLRPMPLGPGATPQLPPPRPQAQEEEGGGGAKEDGGAGGGPSASAKQEGGAASSKGSEGDGEVVIAPQADRQKAPTVPANGKIRMEFLDTEIMDLIRYMADVTGRSFILGEELKGKVTIISQEMVTVAEAYEAFLSALEVEGYTTVTVGRATKVISVDKASQAPTRVYEGDSIPYTDNFITQIFTLANITVSDVQQVVTQLAGPKAKVIAYSPTNTLIITDAAVNIRRMWKIVSQLDVASPKSSLTVIPLRFAEAAEIARIVDEVYGVGESAAQSTSSNTGNTSANRRNRRTQDTQPETATGTSVGQEGKFISKVITDERTNTLIVLANEEGLAAIRDLVAELDIDVDVTSLAQIHVVYLEHADATEVAQVLTNIAQEGASSSGNRASTAANRRPTPTNPRNPQPAPDEPAAGSATALLEDGVKVTADENTNALVIVASPDSFRVLKQVIEKLDKKRKQVFVEAVIMELATDDSFEFGLGFHGGLPDDAGGLSYGAVQSGASSLAFSTQDIVSGLAMGVFGQPITVSTTLGDLTVPAFGIALNALQGNSGVNILSTPNILTLDNEEAKIVVGRNIPFPVSSGLDANGNQLVSYQREDVAITLKVTPQINESDYVTLELFQEVSEIEEDSSGLDVNASGFITSKREAETTVVVRNNQTVVIGGLMGMTDTEVETKVPVLGDLPLVGALFRGNRTTSRKTNLLIFLTPHIVDDPSDLEEVYRIKMAQREEFLRRFYGKSAAEQARELDTLLQYSMNIVDQPSLYRTRPPRPAGENVSTITDPAAATPPPAAEDPALDQWMGDDGTDAAPPVDPP